MVGGPAPEAVYRGGGQPRLHQFVIEQLLLGDAFEVGQPGPVPEHVTDGDGVFAVGAEFGPVGGNGLVVGQHAAVDESVNDRCRHAFRRREHHRAGVHAPRLFARAVRPSRPGIDDRSSVDVHRERTAAEPPTRKQTCKYADHVGEARISGTLHTAGQPIFGAKH